MKTGLALALMLSLGIAGCGDDDDDTPTPDAATPDATAAAPTCEAYCAAVTANCTGDNAQYTDNAECLTMCGTAAAWELGAAADTAGNTLGCRAYHAGAAESSGMPAVHCPHAGASGGNVCGTWCDVYCDFSLKNCTGDNAVFADAAECATACAMFDATGAANSTGGDSVQCRIYHASIPANADAALHCPHTAADGGLVCV